MGWPGPPTYRQHRAFLEWLGRDEIDRLNAPSQESHYLMVVAAEVARVLVMKREDRERITPDLFRLKFSAADASAPREKTAEEKVLEHPELYDAPPVMTREMIERYGAETKIKHKMFQAKRQAAGKKKGGGSAERLGPGEHTDGRRVRRNA